MTEHTPGPWIYDARRGIVSGQPHDHPQERALGIKMAQSAPVVCFVRGYYGSQEADENGAILADALRLREINAELLAALEFMVADQCDYMARNQLGDPEQQHGIKMARAAIAKAEQ